MEEKCRGLIHEIGKMESIEDSCEDTYMTRMLLDILCHLAFFVNNLIYEIIFR